MKFQIVFGAILAVLFPGNSASPADVPACLSTCLGDLEIKCDGKVISEMESCIAASSCTESGRQACRQKLSQLCKGAYITPAPAVPTMSSEPSHLDLKRGWGPWGGSGPCSGGSLIGTGPWTVTGPWGTWTGTSPSWTGTSPWTATAPWGTFTGTGPWTSFGPWGSGIGPGCMGGTPSGPFGGNWGPWTSSGAWTTLPWTSWWENGNCPPGTWSGWTSGTWSTNAPWTTWTSCTATTTGTTTYTTTTTGGSSVTVTGYAVKVAEETTSSASASSSSSASAIINPDLSKLVGIWVSLFTLSCLRGALQS